MGRIRYGVAVTMSERDEKGCPKCGSRSIIGSFDVAAVFEKRGSKLVRKRGVEYAVFDYVCELCGHKWRVRECIKGVPIRRSPLVEKEWLLALDEHDRKKGAG